MCFSPSDGRTEPGTLAKEEAPNAVLPCAIPLSISAASRRTPLPKVNASHSRRVRDFHPRVYAHAGRTREERVQKVWTRSSILEQSHLYLAGVITIFLYSIG
ncbi:hypothetical protein D3C87_131810 [compost metagenome]